MNLAPSVRIACVFLFVAFAAAGCGAQPPQIEPGFLSLFDGRSLDGWIGQTEQYQVVDGALVSKTGGSGKLLTERQYSDFLLRFEFRLTPNANNGLALRTVPEGDAAYVGMESQILDNSGADYASLKAYQYHGSIYGVAPATEDPLRPVGEWNEEEVLCSGRRVRVVVNCRTIVDVDLEEVAPNGRTIDGLEHPGLSKNEGHLGFLSHGSRVDFRNIRVKPLP